jgi:hypothetical protein
MEAKRSRLIVKCAVTDRYKRSTKMDMSNLACRNVGKALQRKAHLVGSEW